MVTFKTRLICCISMFILLSGCAHEIALTGPINNLNLQASHNSKVFISISYASLKPNVLLRSRFFAYQDLVVKSLDQSIGFLGYKRRYTESESWTITIWENEQSFESFINSSTYQNAMIKSYLAMNDARFSKIEAPLKEAIMSWDKANEILESQNSV